MQHNLKSNPLAMLNVLAGRTLDTPVLELMCTLQKNASSALFIRQTKNIIGCSATGKNRHDTHRQDDVDANTRAKTPLRQLILL